MKKNKCPGCSVKEGHLHKDGCGKEICPFCQCQLLFCGCWESKLTAVGLEVPAELEDDFEIRLPEKWDNKWTKMLSKKGRIPYIYYPVICARCGKVNPRFFRVSDKKWKKYIQPNMRNEVLCKRCFKFVVKAINDA